MLSWFDSFLSLIGLIIGGFRRYSCLTEILFSPSSRLNPLRKQYIYRYVWLVTMNIIVRHASERILFGSTFLLYSSFQVKVNLASNYSKVVEGQHSKHGSAAVGNLCCNGSYRVMNVGLTVWGSTWSNIQKVNNNDPIICLLIEVCSPPLAKSFTNWITIGRMLKSHLARYSCHLSGHIIISEKIQVSLSVAWYWSWRQLGHIHNISLEEMFILYVSLRPTQIMVCLAKPMWPHLRKLSTGEGRITSHFSHATKHLHKPLKRPPVSPMRDIAPMK